MNVTMTAQLRYQVIDKRLRNPDNVNHWQNLSEACAEATKEFGGITSAPSKRTIAYDIQRMRSGVLGYHAPIAFNKTTGYYYANPRFSIHNIPLPSHILQECREAVHIMRHLTRNERLASMHHAIVSLEEKLNLQIDGARKPIIYFEKSLNAQGQQWLDEVYGNIRERKAMTVNYHPFDKPATTHIMSPYFIKEYNNRWYVIGYEHTMQKVINLALDRFVALNTSLQTYTDHAEVDHDQTYRHIYGITILDGVSPVIIRFRAIPLLARYLITKPIHESQKVISETDEYTEFSLFVIHNYEIRHKLLSYGPEIEVMEPAALREDMALQAKRTMALYAQNHSS
jgi:predicted DNA-binding transcriptional regulator YafY